MKADRTDPPQQLTTVDPGSEEPPARVTDEQPSVSPDGTKIAFASNAHWDDETSGSYHVDQLDIYVMDAADGGNVRRLTSDASPISPTSIWRAEARTRHGLLTEAALPTRAPRAATVRSGL